MWVITNTARKAVTIQEACAMHEARRACMGPEIAKLERLCPFIVDHCTARLVTEARSCRLTYATHILANLTAWPCQSGRRRIRDTRRSRKPQFRAVKQWTHVTSLGQTVTSRFLSEHILLRPHTMVAHEETCRVVATLDIQQRRVVDPPLLPPPVFIVDKAGALDRYMDRVRAYFPQLDEDDLVLNH